MFTIPQKTFRTVLCAGLLLTACSSNDVPLNRTTHWLGPLAQYQQVTGSEKSGIFILKQRDGARPVGRILMEPVEITISNRSDLNSLTDSMYDRIRSAFADALANRLAEQGDNLAAGKETENYLVRVALTNVTVKRKESSLKDPTLSRSRISFENASIEAELRNKHTNVREAVIITPATAGETTSTNLYTLFYRFAENFATELVTARTWLNSRSSQTISPKKKR
jgi:hypothetical protein